MKKLAIRSALPTWLRWTVGAVAALFVAPFVVGFAAAVGFVLAPLILVGLPMIPMGLGGSRG